MAMNTYFMITIHHIDPQEIISKPGQHKQASALISREKEIEADNNAEISITILIIMLMMASLLPLVPARASSVPGLWSIPRHS